MSEGRSKRAIAAGAGVALLVAGAARRRRRDAADDLLLETEVDQRWPLDEELAPSTKEGRSIPLAAAIGLALLMIAGFTALGTLLIWSAFALDVTLDRVRILTLPAALVTLMAFFEYAPTSKTRVRMPKWFGHPIAKALGVGAAMPVGILLPVAIYSVLPADTSAMTDPVFAAEKYLVPLGIVIGTFYYFRTRRTALAEATR